MAKQYEAIIIGAGIIGAGTAFALAKQGKRTLNLDRLPAAGYGSTSASCAIVRPYYSTVDGSALAVEGHHYWLDWANFVGAGDERGLARYIDCGCLVLKTGRNQALAPVCKIMDGLGVPYRHLDREETRARMPIASLASFGEVKRPNHPGFGEPEGELEGSVFFPTGGYVNDPQLATHNLQRAAEAHGAEFRFNADVAAIRREAGRVGGVTLADGAEIDAPVVVNVAGPHSFKVNRMAGVEAGMKIKTRALRHEVAHVPSPAGFDYEHKGSVFSDSDIGTYTRPEIGNHVLIGSEDPPCDPREWVDPDDYNTEFTEQWQVQVLRQAQRFPELKIPRRAKGVVHLYDVSDDWIPIYDKSDLPGFYMAVGTSGNQFKNGPVVGEMMTALIEACERGHDHDRDPIGFTLRHLGREVSVGFYSRLRQVNASSSFSVLG